MKNRYIQAAIVLGAAAGLLILLFFAVKTKKLRINRWIVSDRDVIGVDISEYQADVDMPVLMEQGSLPKTGKTRRNADFPRELTTFSLLTVRDRCRRTTTSKQWEIWRAN